MQQQPPGSPYSSHGSPLRTPMSSGHGTPQDSPHVARHRRDSEHSAGVGSRRGSSDVASPLPDAAPPSGSPDNRQPRRRSDYSPHQGRSRCDSRLRQLTRAPTLFSRQFGGGPPTKSRTRDQGIPRAIWLIWDRFVPDRGENRVDHLASVRIGQDWKEGITLEKDDDPFARVQQSRTMS